MSYHIARNTFLLTVVAILCMPTLAMAQSPRLTVEDAHFVDSHGRQVLLHGMNVISKSKAQNYLSWHGPDDFAAMRRWGMNCVRLGILWDGVEPEPGKFDDAYLDGVAQRVAWAKKNGLYVFLDMHQDLYSVLYSDGAPEWATLHEDKPHVTGSVWSDAYMVSPAVQTSFDNFWANTPAADGVGLQDHYAAAWRHVAKRFAGESAVIGYDLMNEPFPGTAANEIQAALLQSRFAQILAERSDGKVNSPEEIAAMWLQPEGRQQITALLDDMHVYAALVEAQEDLSVKFERQNLQPMYQRVTNAIRQVDQDHLILLETSYYCNSGVRCGIEPVNGLNGQRDPNQAFVPHGYDIVVDTPGLAGANSSRVELIFKRHAETARRLDMPMIVGEWGAFGNWDERILPSARVIQRLFEKHLCGDTYWDYGRDIQTQAYFPVLCRSLPQRIAGTLLSYQSNPETGLFTCRWEEAAHVTVPTIIYLTAGIAENVELTPKGTRYEFEFVQGNSGPVYLIIPPTGKAVDRTLTVRPTDK